MENFIMTNKTILITGCSSGIGKATAQHFADKGWNVVATMRNTEDGKDLAKQDNVLVTKLDVTDEVTINDTIEKTIEKFVTIDVLVNNAGYGTAGVLEAFPLDNIRRQFEVNVIGLLATTQVVLPIMRKQKSGTIINISSIGGRATFPLFSLYHGTKFAVEGITESLQYELNPIGIDVKLVEPGAIATDFATRSLDMQTGDESLGEYSKTVTDFMTAMQGLANTSITPDYVARAIEEAIESDELRHLVGEDAKQIMQLRQASSDKKYVQAIKEQFGI